MCCFLIQRKKKKKKRKQKVFFYLSLFVLIATLQPLYSNSVPLLFPNRIKTLF